MLDLGVNVIKSLFSSSLKLRQNKPKSLALARQI